MRSVVFVERLELDFEGNLFANALMLGDVDNDGVSTTWFPTCNSPWWRFLVL